MCVFLVSQMGCTDQRGLSLIELKENNISILYFLHTTGIPTYITSFHNYYYVSFKCNDMNEGAGIGSYKIVNNQIIEISFYNSCGRSYSHLCVDKNENYVFAANYNVGATAMYKIESHKIIDKICSYHHEGKGPDVLKRQVGPHAHCVGLLPFYSYLYSVDLGADKVYLYDFSDSTLNNLSHLQLNILPGSGPRHMIFSKNGMYTYIICEISNHILVYKHNKTHFSLIQSIHCIPRHFKGFSSASAIRFSPSFNYLFVSNRGHNSIAMYRVNQDNGKLALLYMIHTDINPIDFNFINNKYITVACYGGNKLQFLSFNEDNEELVLLPYEINIEKPSCILELKIDSPD